MRTRSSSLNWRMRSTISLKCRASTPNSSSVATSTGAGAASSATCRIAPMKRWIGRSTTSRIVMLIRRPMATMDAAIVRGRKGEYKKELDKLRRDGFARVSVDGEIFDLGEEIRLDKNRKHTI